MACILNQIIPGSCCLSAQAMNRDILYNIQKVAEKKYESSILPNSLIKVEGQLMTLTFIIKVNSILNTDEYPIDNICNRESINCDVDFTFHMNVNLFVINLDIEIKVPVKKISDALIECQLSSLPTMSFLVAIEPSEFDFRNDNSEEKQSVYSLVHKKNILVGSVMKLKVLALKDYMKSAVSFCEISSILE